MAYLLEDFAPQRVLRHFEDICAIPHGSGNELALGEHILALASHQKLETQRDSAGNILVRVPASPGYEKVPSLLLQGHLDMVCTQEKGMNKDFLHEPIQLVLDGHILRANGSSLGADNAVGLCNMMALMEADDLRHPPLELLFTTREEVGLEGIRQFDMTQLRSRRMLNVDMGDPDCMVIGSAGCGKFALEKYCEMTAADGQAITVGISGLQGGHSGLMAGKNHASALELAGRVLSALTNEMPARLASLQTVGTGTSIPTDVTLTLHVPCETTARALLEQLAEQLYAELTEEPECCISVKQAHVDAAASVADTRALADLLLLIPYGVSRRSTEHPEWVLCSSLLVQASYDADFFTGLFCLRANRDTDLARYQLWLHTICRMTETSCRMLGDWIPAWPEQDNSPLQQLCRSVYYGCFHEELAVEVEHGTVEVSVIAQAIPDMDIVGLAPKSRGAHTSEEHLYLDTMEPFWLFLTTLLEKMCQ